MSRVSTPQRRTAAVASDTEGVEKLTLLKRRKCCFPCALIQVLEAEKKIPAPSRNTAACCREHDVQRPRSRKKNNSRTDGWEQANEKSIYENPRLITSFPTLMMKKRCRAHPAAPRHWYAAVLRRRIPPATASPVACVADAAIPRLLSFYSNLRSSCSFSCSHSWCL